MVLRACEEHVTNRAKTQHVAIMAGEDVDAMLIRG